MDPVPESSEKDEEVQVFMLKKPDPEISAAFEEGSDFEDAQGEHTFDPKNFVESSSSTLQRYDGSVNIHQSLENKLHLTEKGVQSNPLEDCGLRGLRNIGNTCYMNSILQCLSNTKPLLQLIIKNEKFDLNEGSIMKGELFVAYSKLIREIWSPGSKPSYVDTTKLKDKIQKYCPTFRGMCQQDSQELLRFLIEGLHSDTNRVKKKPRNETPTFPDGFSDSELSDLSWKWNLRYDDSIISDIFVGQLKSTLKCLSCGNLSTTFDPFWDLSLSLPQESSKAISLAECLELFTQDELLAGDEKPYCSSCKKAQRATKRFSIQKFPDVLVIHLKRFSRDTRGKLRTVVKFPFENLNMGIYGSDPVNHISYNLYAISNHFGTPYSGHYIAYSKHPYSQEWHKYDDTRVSSCGLAEVGNVEAYVLFYELCLASKSLMDR